MSSFNLFNFWRRYFSLKADDDKDLTDRIYSKFKYENGKLKVE